MRKPAWAALLKGPKRFLQNSDQGGTLRKFYMKVLCQSKNYHEINDIELENFYQLELKMDRERDDANICVQELLHIFPYQMEKFFIS